MIGKIQIIEPNYNKIIFKSNITTIELDKSKSINYFHDDLIEYDENNFKTISSDIKNKKNNRRYFNN